MCATQMTNIMKKIHGMFLFVNMMLLHIQPKTLKKGEKGRGLWKETINVKYWLISKLLPSLTFENK